MPRITRKQQKVFAVNATNNGVFGSLQANDPVHSQDPDVIQGRTAYSNGWDDATYSAEKLPPLEEFQALQYLFSRQLAYIMQDGIPEWDTNTTYYKGALVKAIQGDGSFILYASLVDNNQGNLVTDTTKWIITNTSTNFHQGIPNWRADVIYSAGDWVKALNGGQWTIFESTQNNNLNNQVTDSGYWQIRPFSAKLPIFWNCFFDYEINDVSWLRADTFSWQDGTVYTEAYNHLVADYNGGTSQTETVGSYTITYVLATDGHKITTDETNVANIYNKSGVAWYYILDTTNQRFKLPRENPAREELIQVVRAKGDGLTLGLTHGTVTVGLGSNSSYQLAAYRGNYGQQNTGTPSGNTSGNENIGITSDSTKSGIISDMKDSTSVYKGKQYLYFYVGQFSQTATEQTAGLNSELFNGKLDLDAGNATQATKETIGSWSTSSKNLGDNGYVKLSNGLIIQWGITSNNAATYQTPFTSGTSYSIVVEQKRGSQYGQTAVISTSSTGFTAGSNANTPLFWIAIGY